MCKLLRGTLLPCVLACLVGPAYAGVGGYIGWWNSKGMGDAAGFGVKLEQGLVPLFNVDVRASYYSFGTPDMASVPLELAASANAGLFYGGVGGGYYFFTARDQDASNEWGGFVVVGADIAVAGTGVFGEARYTLVDTRVDGRRREGNGFGVSVGALLAW